MATFFIFGLLYLHSSEKYCPNGNFFYFMNAPQSLSFWERESFFTPFDFVVIGSGIVGLSTAFSLREKNKSARIAIVERGVLPSGGSTRNAGFACFGSVGELLDDLKTHSEPQLLDLIAMRYEGLLKLREKIGDKALRYEARGGNEIFKTNEANYYKECKHAIPYFNALLEKNLKLTTVFSEQKTPKSFKNCLPLQIHNAAEGQINTGAMMTALLKKAQQKNIIVFNGLEIVHLETTSKSVNLHTRQGWHFESQKVCVTTNAFTKSLLPDLNIEPARNQVLVTAPIKNLGFKGCFHYDKGYFYFRNVGNRVLIGGGRHLFREQENTDQFGTTENIRTVLENLLHEVVLPDEKNIEITDAWSGILGLGSEKKPILQKINDRIFVGVRMGGMGVAIGSAVGEKLAALAN